MRKINYEQEALICIYDGIVNTIKELETHYKDHPSKSISEEILAYLNEQRNYLKMMKKAGINSYLLKSLTVNAKRLSTKNKLKDANKITSKRIGIGASFVVSALLVSSLLVDKSLQDELKFKGELLLEGNIDSFGELFESLEKEKIDVVMEPIVGTHLERTYTIKTLEMDKYYDIACPDDLQDYFYELEDKWGIPAIVGMILVDKESDGKWSTNGVISPTNDYGLPQINITNLAYIKRHLGYTTDDILNDPYKSLDAMFFLLTSIFDHYGYTKDNYDLINVAGAYNGWVNWRNKEQSVQYVEDCVTIYNTKFTKDNDAKLLVNEL